MPGYLGKIINSNVFSPLVPFFVLNDLKFILGSYMSKSLEILISGMSINSKLPKPLMVIEYFIGLFDSVVNLSISLFISKSPTIPLKLLMSV